MTNSIAHPAFYSFCSLNSYRRNNARSFEKRRSGGHDAWIGFSWFRPGHDQGRPLGQLGIHGVGMGDMKVHETVNWTEGCIALTNEQVRDLAKWVVVGTRVVVR